jgi:hypothetical protein
VTLVDLRGRHDDADVRRLLDPEPGWEEGASSSPVLRSSARATSRCLCLAVAPEQRRGGTPRACRLIVTTNFGRSWRELQRWPR